MLARQSAAMVRSTATWPAPGMCVVIRRRDHFRFLCNSLLGQRFQDAGQNPLADFMMKDPDAMDSSGECGLAPDLRVGPKAGTQPKREESAYHFAVHVERTAEFVDLDAALAKQ
jgi:hypothetical protein